MSNDIKKAERFENLSRRRFLRGAGAAIALPTLASLAPRDAFAARVLKKILANDHREEFYTTLASKLMTYATGRGMEYYDVETIDQVVKRLESQDGKFGALLAGIIDSAPFQKMRTQATVTAAN